MDSSKEAKQQEPERVSIPFDTDVMCDTPVIVQLKCSLQDIENLYKKEFLHSENTLELAQTKIAELFIGNNFKYVHVFNIIEIKNI